MLWDKLIEAGQKHADWSERLNLMLRTGDIDLKSERIPPLLECIERQTAAIKSVVRGLKDFEVF